MFKIDNIKAKIIRWNSLYILTLFNRDYQIAHPNLSTPIKE